MNKVNICSFRPADKNETLELLAQAFYSDPMFKYIYDKKTVSHKRVKIFFKLVLNLSSSDKNIRLLKVDETIVGVMIFYPPQNSYSSLQAMLETVYFFFVNGLTATRRMLNVIFESDKHYCSLFDYNYYILHYIAIHEDFRKRGYSKLLLEYLKQEAVNSSHCKGIVLEAREHLVEFYTRFGYRVKQKVNYCGQKVNFMVFSSKEYTS